MVKKPQKKDIVVDEANKAGHSRGVSVTRSCNLVHTPKSTYYRRVKGLGKRQSADQALHTRIKALQEQHLNRYGILRMTAALCSDVQKSHLTTMSSSQTRIGRN